MSSSSSGSVYGSANDDADEEDVEEEDVDEFPDDPDGDELFDLYKKAVAIVRADRSKKRRIREILDAGDDEADDVGIVRSAPVPCRDLAIDDGVVRSAAELEAKAFLEGVKVCVVDWTDDISYHAPEGSAVRCGPKKQLFPHKIRNGTKNSLQVFVETNREVRIYCHIVSKATGQRIKDDELVLRHANALLPAGAVPRMGISFECFIVYSSSDDEATAMPIAHGPANHFSVEIADITPGGELATALFVDQQPGVNGRIAEVKAGVALAENIKLKKEVLTSNLVTTGKFRFAFKPTHPALSKLSAWTARSQSFVTSARVRGLSA